MVPRLPAAPLTLLISGHRRADGTQDIDRCEDAPPCWEELPDGQVLIAVADGLGGYALGYDDHTGGYWAASIVRATLREFVAERRTREWPAERFGEELTGAMRAPLAQAAQRLPASRVRIPYKVASTLAGALVCFDGLSEGARARLFFIGDSRVLWLTEDGLHQLSMDDMRQPGDAFEALTNDSPMSQFLAANMEPGWRIHCLDLDLPPRGLLIACTDGCFAYWKAPWELELALGQAFRESEDWAGWLGQVRAGLERVRSDDASLAALPLGGADFAAYREVFCSRQIHGERCDQAVAALGDDFQNRKRVWQEVYKPFYEALLPAPGELHTPGAPCPEC